jgi:glutathionylspermidine synthase
VVSHDSTVLTSDYAFQKEQIRSKNEYQVKAVYGDEGDEIRVVKGGCQRGAQSVLGKRRLPL